MDYMHTQSAASASVESRSSFLVRTYLHLFGAIVAFVGIEFALFASGIAHRIAETVLGSGMSWLLVLGLFIAVSWVADRWARSATSSGMQYAGLGFFVVAEAILFCPLLFVAAYYASPDVIPNAAITTLVLFGSLTGIVFLTRRDFSFLRGVLFVGAIAAFGLIAAGAIFGFTLGVIFSWAMLALAAGYVLYDTSNVLHHYRTDQHVAASLALFASVALMFWYVLRILLDRR